jgi:hypothetical protein
MYNDDSIGTVEQLRTFLVTADIFSIKLHCSRKERAQWVYDRLVRFRYQTLRKRDKSTVREYLLKVSGYKKRQIDRHIDAYKNGKKLCQSYKRHAFTQTYTKVDAERLAKTDDLHAGEHGKLHGMAVQEICKEEYERGEQRYGNLAHASVATIYRLRQTKRYKEQCQSIEKTKPKQNSIGIRKKPEPHGQPGFLRVDTVHQGDYEGKKGVYHLNPVDEVTQWEVPFAVQELAMNTVGPALEEAFEEFPFVIQSAHSDPGGEYLNEIVEALFVRLGVDQTKSRPGKCTDNALVECKNGVVIRKHMGYAHIPQPFAARINQFYKKHFIPYLNFHRPCMFPTIEVDAKGREQRIYYRKDCMTPYKKFLSLKEPEQYLREGWTLERLERMAKEKTPNQAVSDMKRSKQELKILIDKAFDELTK